MSSQSAINIPIWVPKEVKRYLEHTEGTSSIRQLARERRCHPSTILRQIRKVENRRDDPLVDCALSDLAQGVLKKGPQSELKHYETQDALATATLEALARLNQSGAVLAVAEGMEKAVVVREGEGTVSKHIVEQRLAGFMALLDWITCTRSGRLRRYHITATGRAVYSRSMAGRENQARANAERGFGETQKDFLHFPTAKTKERRGRYGLSETPLDMLARLQDKTGGPFLAKELVEAGKRLREDYELAQVGEHLAQKQAYFEASSQCGRSAALKPSPASQAAKSRSMAALAALGAGLNDIALRCCCHLEGLEAAERQLGWSARSGKIVLRIALSQLKSFYDQLDKDTVDGQSSRMIG